MVNVDEVITSVKDLDRAVCGFKVYKDRVEIFDKELGTVLYGEALREAYSSGRCEVVARYRFE